MNELTSDAPEDLADLERSVCAINQAGADAIDDVIASLEGDVTPAQQRAAVLEYLRTRPIDCKLADGTQVTVHFMEDDTIKHSPYYGGEFTAKATPEDIALMYAAVVYAHAERSRIEAEIASGERTSLGLRRGSGTGTSGSFRNTRDEYRRHTP